MHILTQEYCINYRGPSELFRTFLCRRSSHRRKSAACPKFDMVWLDSSPISWWGGGSLIFCFLLQMISTCLPSRYRKEGAGRHPVDINNLGLFQRCKRLSPCSLAPFSLVPLYTVHKASFLHFTLEFAIPVVCFIYLSPALIFSKIRETISLERKEKNLTLLRN